ncbi:n-acetylgalactosaminyltransferase [Holotrichia oblita]|uniref:N-acetylgalactosaminyltransferase n=1 Tax=Holotrichia oblita TaxID=644536 RepID=A0ACB9TEN1_HOLOL|nr:n-acetylgalactosaminyltransferase [Holotrichia oblita]
MVSINRSFLYGICFASVTWIISLYLFWQLNKSINILQQPTMYPSNSIKTINSYEGGKIHNFKDETKEEKQAFKQYINNIQAHKDLQPVYRNPGLDAYERDLIELGMVKTMADKRMKEDGYKRYAFNNFLLQVIVFLDSHIEVNTDWLRPLLSKIKESKTNVAIPVIDIINADTFTYTASPLVRGGFNWGLHFKWENLPTGTLTKDDDFVKPIKSPTMAGGLFAIDRQYFIDMGEYDAGMNVWGGENIEISFRLWMCGGKLELIPCSRVGHVFRQRRPYGAPDGQDTMLYNSLRVAHVWMDDYKVCCTYT